MVHPCAELPEAGLGNGLLILPTDAPLNSRKPGVLIADDEARLRALLPVTLRQCGFAAWVAADGPELLALYREKQPHIDLVVLDIGMPELEGRAMLRALREINPEVRCCFMAETADYAYERDLLDLGAARIFQKPLKPVVFAYMLWQLLGKAPPVPCRIISEEEAR